MALQQILDRTVADNKIFGAAFSVSYQGKEWHGAAGNLDIGQQYFIASTTKLFVTALILNFRQRGFLSLDDTIDRFLEPEIIKNLHVYKGTDYSGKITIQHLLTHTSGIPDYFQQKTADGSSFEKELLKGIDRHWTFRDTVEYSKGLEPYFIPGKKAHYSDTNFQLLGEIIRGISGASLEENINRIILDPLGLTKTYMFSDISDKHPMHLYYKEKELHVPKAMSSFGPDGGMVSTSVEMLTFIQAFFEGNFFPKSFFPELQQWKNIFFPIQSGIGIHRFKLPWLMSFGTIPEMVGHSGLSGAMAYYCPKKDFYISGTVNQIATPGLSFKVAIKLLQHVLKNGL